MSDASDTKDRILSETHLRDEFARTAMRVILERSGKITTLGFDRSSADILAASAYVIADAMMKARAPSGSGRMPQVGQIDNG